MKTVIKLSVTSEEQRQLLKLFYTAAVHLQRLYQTDLHIIMDSDWVWLPDMFGEELGIDELVRDVQECYPSFNPL